MLFLVTAGAAAQSRSGVRVTFFRFFRYLSKRRRALSISVGISPRFLPLMSVLQREADNLSTIRSAFHAGSPKGHNEFATGGQTDADKKTNYRGIIDREWQRLGLLVENMINRLSTE
jgi:hypothetical protein